MTDEEYKEEEERAAMREATIRVLQGNSRDEAIAKTRFIRPMRDAADNENAYIPLPGGDRSYHDSTLNYPDGTKMNPAQKEAIYRTLCEQEGIDP